jgi:formylglycine-generating enzyme
MKKSVLVVLALLTLSTLWVSCGSTGGEGQLVGVQERPKWRGINPYGMVYVPSGSFNMGPNDQDLGKSFLQKQKTITIGGFYMDDTEITNNEYRQFVHWVRDSIAHILLGDVYEDDLGNERIDWSFDIDFRDELLDEMFYQGEDVMYGKRELNVSKLEFEYSWIDMKAAANNKEGASRSQFIKKDKLPIYPDTMVWIRDFSYSYNEPMTRNYFWHPAYDDYPVVGVSWRMARAFSHWRTKIWNDFAEGQLDSEGFRLPLEAEWEYAARGGAQQGLYPWGSYYLRNAKGCLLANFKPGRGDYSDDGGAWTVPVGSYYANDYGLFDMAGNVAEWTLTAFSENAYNFYHDFNPDYRYDAEATDPESYKRKVVRGGSWKDVGYFLQNGVRSWEYQDTTKAHIGFRNVLPFLGRSINDF